MARCQRTVNQLMTEAVLSVDLGSPVSEALRLFAEYPVHHLPVVRERTLVGMLSSADIMKLDAFLPKSHALSGDYIDQRFTIEKLMSHPVVSALPHQSAEEAARLMATHAVHALPVVNEQQHLVGIITTTDMMQALLFGPSCAETPTDAAPLSESTATTPAGDAFERSLETARRVVRGGADPDGLARALLHSHERVCALEAVQRQLRGYAAASRDEIETLLRALEGAETAPKSA